MPRNKIICLMFFSLTVSLTSAYGERFIESYGMRVFNRGEFNSAIDSIKAFIERNPSEEGIARYFLGESFYNLGLVEEQLTTARAYFEQAYTNFNTAIGEADLRTKHRDNLYMAQYKKAWCQFRRVELGGDIGLLNSAYSGFISLDANAPDSLKILARYMAGESKLREGVFKKYDVMQRDFSASEINEILGIFSTANSQFKKVTQSDLTPLNLKICAQIRLQDINYQIGKVYQILPQEIFAKIDDPKKKSTVSSTAIWYFNQANYRSILASLKGNQKKEVAPIINYSEALKYLNIYLTFKSDESSQMFSTCLDSLKEVEEFKTEKLFRMGSRDQSSHSDSPEFTKLSLENKSYYAQASGEIGEAYYWLGFVQLIRDSKDSRKNFDNFISSRKGKLNNLRIEALLEDAKLRKYTLDFEEFRVDLSELKRLKKELGSFSPQSKKIQEEEDFLHKLVRIELGESIWAGILTGVEEKKLDECMSIIRYLLKRAASVVGERRMHYLGNLDKVFGITQYKRPKETNFYRGIAKSLEAEIDITPEAKKRKFLDATGLLQGVASPYDVEASYIRGRCFFFANEYDKATAVFQDLVNQKKSLRSLFYLGEIFRAKGNPKRSGRAAKRCYEIVKVKTAGKTEGEFWFNNSAAAMVASPDIGDLSALSGINIDNVDFPEVLLTVDGDTISYEKLADMKYLKHQYGKECVEMLKKYALPKKSIYPSLNRLKQSIFLTQEAFKEFSTGINERKGPVTAGLRLKVLYPKGVKHECTVYLDGEKLSEEPDGFYRKRSIDLNTELKIRILNPQCYLFVEKHRFLKLGEDPMTIRLSKRVNFKLSRGGKGFEIQRQFFRENSDGNFVIHKAGELVPEETQLYEDFSSSIAFRDFVFDENMGRFLVIDSENDKIWKYKDDGKISKDGEFSLRFKGGVSALESPEGIALDSKDNVYVADWGNHRVVIFNSAGSYKDEFGVFGENKNKNVGERARFVFPTRIAIEEPPAGSDKERHIIVADRNGIHKFDSKGNYLDSPIKAGKHGFKKGDFYGIAIRGYGEGSELYIIDRETGKIKLFKAE